MKGLFLAYMALLALVACTAQQSTVQTTGAPALPLTPASYAAGSTANTTTRFDGTWIGGPVKNVGSVMPGGGENASSCPNYAAPTMIISNGLAQFDVLNIRFQGYVTPQGRLEMRTGVGQRFEGQINPQNVLSGRVFGACAYEATWQKSA